MLSILGGLMMGVALVLEPLEWLFNPVHSGGAGIAAVGLARDDGTPAVDADRIPLLTNLLDQVALALERT